jgi:hypothetical protein
VKTRAALFFFLFNCCGLFAQTLNCYAKVTGIAGNVFSVSNVNETFDTFEDGEDIVIMQMQDNTIGSIANNATFGDLGAIGSAGLYEVRTILSHTESAGLPVTITISAATTNAYNTGANSSLQIISFRNMGVPLNYTTSAAISAITWNGNIGGVVALYIPGTLTLANNISVNAQGFAGGLKSIDYYDGTTNCYTSPFVSGNNQDGFKGESIFKRTLATQTNSRAKILNGGGGGVQINTGGGGGGNYTAGGNGGNGWNGGAGCTTVTGGFGYGGIALSAVVSAGRVFMGGGGGGGQQNNGVGTSGGAGGGIILIRANLLLTTGACGPLSITANGQSSSNSGNDGAGGAGAAGSIVLQVNSFSVAASCPLTIAANGGTGGNVNDAGTHSGGGAGAQGSIVFSAPLPSTNITVTTLNGSAGCNNNSSPCNSSAGAASGSNNSGIVANTGTPLPIELLSFNAEACEKLVCLDWTSATETNNDYYTVERSAEGTDFQKVTTVDGAGNSSAVLNYSAVDTDPLNGVSYYRLKQTDFNGLYSNSGIVAVDRPLVQVLFFDMYPNPGDGSDIHLAVSGPGSGEIRVMMYDFTGRELYSGTIQKEEKSDVVVTANPENKLSPGIYLLTITSGRQLLSKKLIVNKR